MTRNSQIRVALGQYDIGWHDPEASLERATRIVAECAAAGARLVVLPEMCTSGFTMDVANYSEPMTGERVTRLSHMARSASVWLIAGVPTEDVDAGACVARNSAIVFSPTGEVVAAYHKQRLFAYANEQRSYRPGDAPVIIDVEGVRVAPFICYDLRFPELFRRVARDVDVMVVIASWPAARRTHWDTLLRARAIENQCYMIGVNRIGEGGGIQYDGGSAAFDPWGAELELSAVPRLDGISTVLVSCDEAGRVRSAYPFLADAPSP
jgi:omega-amidase